MGQRTLIVCKRNFADGTTSTSFQYHQWGIGKMMTTQFMQELLAVAYPIKPLGSGENRKTLKDFFLFNDKEELRSVVSNNVDVWNKSEVLPYINRYDNNNGVMICEVTEKEGNSWSTCLNISEVKLGFLLGDEETYHLSEEPFTRFVSAREYQILTGGNYCNKAWIECFDNFLKHFEVIQVVDDIETTVEKELENNYFQWLYKLYGREVTLDVTKLNDKASKRYAKLDKKKVSVSYSVHKDGTIKCTELDLDIPISAVDVKKIKDDTNL